MTGLVLPLPQRHQRSRRAGWRKPPGAVIVDRTSRWGNDFRVGDTCRTAGGPFAAVTVVIPDRAYAAGLFQMKLARDPELAAAVQRELAGRDVCCACPLDDACHGDVLLACAAQLPGWNMIPPHSLRIILGVLSRAA